MSFLYSFMIETNIYFKNQNLYNDMKNTIRRPKSRYYNKITKILYRT